MVLRIAGKPNSPNSLVAKMILEAFAMQTHAHLKGMLGKSWTEIDASFALAGERARFRSQFAAHESEILNIPIQTLCSTPYLVEQHLGIVYENQPIKQYTPYDITINAA